MLSFILAAFIAASPGNQIYPVVHQLSDDVRLVQLSAETAVEQMTGRRPNLTSAISSPVNRKRSRLLAAC